MYSKCLNSFSVCCVDCFFPCIDRQVLIRKHGSLLGYLSSWLYPYHCGASSSIWFTTLSRTSRNPSSGNNINSHSIQEQKSRSSFSLLCFWFFCRILWMVPIYSLDSVSCIFFNHCHWIILLYTHIQQKRCFNVFFFLLIILTFCLTVSLLMFRSGLH